MQKVRWTQKCAGGCGNWLTVGVYATHLHGGYWCTSCLNRHRPNCQTLVASGK